MLNTPDQTNEALTFLKEVEDTGKSLLNSLKEDLTIEKDEIFTRRNPLLGITYKEKIQEITQRLGTETRGKQRDSQIKTLETCYYLGQLRESHKESKQRIKDMRNILKKSLGTRRATRSWKCAERINELLQICGLQKLFSTTIITFSNLEELSEEDFTELLDEVKIHGVHS